ncbi:MAG: hypothetical protein OEL88_15385 [Sterolibacteriaceae bacterium MAG5]|nr:hypothetical protein [Candidatus Nitricoxidireducens bremensis]
MIGLIFLAVLAAVLGLAVLLSRHVTRHIQNRFVRSAAIAAMTLGIMSLLVIDELIGGYQFRQLCRENAVLRIDAEKARGRTVKVVVDPSNETIPQMPITIYHSHLRFLDVSTNEKIAEYHSYVAKGGWFIRLLGISEGNAPLTIGLPGCSPKNSGTFRKQYGLTLVN